MKLTRKEDDWYDWALGCRAESLNDADFVRDNPDCHTESFSQEDMLYRLDVQARDMARASSLSDGEYWGNIRVLNSLIGKLRESGRLA